MNLAVNSRGQYVPAALRLSSVGSFHIRLGNTPAGTRLTSAPSRDPAQTREGVGAILSEIGGDCGVADKTIQHQVSLSRAASRASRASGISQSSSKMAAMYSTHDQPVTALMATPARVMPAR